MKIYTLRLLVLFAAFMFGFRPTLAQEFRISTRVFNEAAKEENAGRSPVVSRSLTLFHAGKIYDYLDSMGEVIVIEPAHNRFTIMNTSRHMATTVDFDEIKRMLKLREAETRRYIEELVESGDPKAAEARKMLEFQMSPEFSKDFEPMQKRVTLTSDILAYDVKVADAKSEEILKAYLAYADWMARLNSVLHPQSLFPAPRIALNEAMREQKLLPVDVTLQAEFEARIHLRAQHSFGWSLDTLDRKLINNWEQHLKSDDLDKISLHDYQRRILLSEYRR